jgi:YrbI family 3-deoxy-D-manno-octulosonate 8-phosphate phosphatase
MTLVEKCRPIKLLLSDVDGVLSDGRLTYDAAGIESKQFHIRDGMGIRLWQQAGLEFGLVTARMSPIVERRAKELDITILRQGDLDKLAKTREIAAELGLELNEICYLGDDLPDLAAIEAVGLGAAVADGAFEVCNAADFVTSLPGGCGALRELVEMILQTTGKWDALVEKYRFSASSK